MMEQMSQGRMIPLPSKTISPGTIDLVNKMMKRDPKKRPRSNQLVLCPILLSSITKVYLNVGRFEKAQMLGKDTILKNSSTTMQVHSLDGSSASSSSSIE